MIRRVAVGRRAACCMAIAAGLAATHAGAASAVLVPTDRNHGIEVLDVRCDGAHTTLLYYTHPEIGQAHAAERCAARLYTLTLATGLTVIAPQLLTDHLCGALGLRGRFVPGGTAVIVAGTRVERWRAPASRAEVLDFKGSPVFAGWRLDPAAGMRVAISQSGEVIVAAQQGVKRGERPDASIRVVALRADGGVEWQADLGSSGVVLGLENLWAVPGAGALIEVLAHPAQGKIGIGRTESGSVVTDEMRTYLIDRSGAVGVPAILAASRQPDPASPPAMPDPGADPAAFQRAMQAMQERFRLESIRKAVAHERADGHLDVLIDRSSGDATREGTFLLEYVAGRAAPVESASAPTQPDRNASPWHDFAVGPHELVLYGAIAVGRNRVNQGYLTFMDLERGAAVTRLVPLDTSRLEEINRLGDEARGQLADNPDQHPVLLTSVDGGPLAVSLVRRAGRDALQFDEARDLPVLGAASDQPLSANRSSGQNQTERKNCITFAPKP
jgi:hypothetical protein